MQVLIDDHSHNSERNRRPAVRRCRALLDPRSGGRARLYAARCDIYLSRIQAVSGRLQHESLSRKTTGPRFRMTCLKAQLGLRLPAMLAPSNYPHDLPKTSFRKRISDAQDNAEKRSYFPA